MKPASFGEWFAVITFILVQLGGGITLWVKLSSKVDSNDDKLDSVIRKQTIQDTAMRQFELQFERLKVTQDSQLERLDRLEEKLDDMRESIPLQLSAIEKLIRDENVSIRERVTRLEANAKI